MVLRKAFAALAVVSTVAQAQDWDGAYAKAEAALAQLTLSEKVGMVTGLKWQGGPCVGNVSPVPKIGYPSLCLQDGPLGIRFAQPVTAFPAGINAAATWDAALIKERGAAMGKEAKAWGINVQLGPALGPMGKIAQGGRNWEGFSPDPYLAGVATANAVEGMQGSGVQACAKHFIVNEQELRRDVMSSNVDDRTLHELYLWPFADGIKAGVTSIMCSYNKVNGTWACESEDVMTRLLKEEMGFRGFVLSDWNAQHTTEGSANSGLDQTQPGSDFNQPPGSVYWGANLEKAVQEGSVPESRVDDMVKRNLAGWYLLGQDKDYPAVEWSSWQNGGRGGPDLTGEHKDVARRIARDSIILLKNTNGTLPLNKPASIAVIGQDAINNPDGINACADRGCNKGHLAQGWGSGSVEYPYLVAPLDAIKAQAEKDGTTIVESTTDSLTEGAAAAAKADLAMVFITADSGEGYITVENNAGDRNDLDPWHDGNGLVEAVAQAGKPTVVVVNTVGVIILERILAQPNVVAVVWAGLGGQESGNALADVIYGAYSPSGKLPYTIAKDPADYGTAAKPGDDDYAEGLYIDYRHFDRAGIEPRYEFGFGLSYTNFDFADLTVAVDAPSGPVTGAIAPGGVAALFETVGTVTAAVSNTGKAAGAEVAQLYITYPDYAPETPPRQLRGFAKVPLEPGTSGTATFTLRRKDLAYWDVAGQQWVVPQGEFKVVVGASSRDGKLEGAFTVA